MNVLVHVLVKVKRRQIASGGSEPTCKQAPRSVQSNPGDALEWTRAFRTFEPGSSRPVGDPSLGYYYYYYYYYYNIRLTAFFPEQPG